jgi:signal transduction histidine kinase/ligand-binding sensor domain-containing protein
MQTDLAGLRCISMWKRSAFAAFSLVGVLACCAWAFALDPSLDVSQYAHTIWKTRDGFANGVISSIAQTPDGYLWLGTELGIFRFDGLRAIPWQPEGDQHLPPGSIFSLLVTRSGVLWIGTRGGLASWTGTKFTRYPELDGSIVYALLEDREGTVWVGAGGTPGSGKICAVRTRRLDCVGGEGQLGPAVVALYQDARGVLWAGVKDGLWRWSPGPPRFYALPGELDGIQALAEDEDGALLIGWKGRISRFIEGKTQPYSLGSFRREFRAHRLLRDNHGSLWIGTSDSALVHLHNGRTDLFSSIDGLSSDSIDAIFEDREGNVWISTTEGLDRFRDYAVARITSKQGLLSNIVGSVLVDKDGSIWLATYGGLNRWEDGKVTVPEAASAMQNGKVNGFVPNLLFQDDDKRLWLSTPRELGYLESGRFISIKGVPAGNVLSIVQDTSSNVWVLNEFGGLLQVSPKNTVKQIQWSSLGHKDHASVLAADPNHGGLWVGFFLGGIAYFSGAQIHSSYTATDGLAPGRVSDFQFDDDGTLWISTENGLSRLKNGRITTLTSKDGLPCNAINWTIEDDDNFFWLYTTCGLVRVTRTELNEWAAAVDKQRGKIPSIKVTTFDSSDGVRSASPTHYHPQVAKTTDGKIWFLPWDGVSVIDPHHLPFNKIPPPVYIEKITADDKAVEISNSMHLPTAVRHLDIDYTALSLAVPEKVRFRVKLEGEDSDWRELVNVRHVEYTNLPPKHYKFRVLACNNSGVWNEEGAALDFVIPPAWYQTNWFRGACIAAFLMMIWGAHEFRVRQLAAQFNMRLEERVAERTRIARDLHDTLLQSFQGLLLQFKAISYRLQPGEIKSALDSAIGDASQAITEGRDTVQGLRASTIQKNDLAVAIRAIGEELATAEASQSPPTIHVFVEGTPRNLHPILRDEVYRTAAEALRNAFHHAEAHQIEVELRYDSKDFKVRVRDDGKGIAPEILSSDGRKGHFGLHGMRERAKVAGGELAIWSEVDSGTEIELTIPASRAYTTSARRFWWFRKPPEKDADMKDKVES